MRETQKESRMHPLKEAAADGILRKDLKKEADTHKGFNFMGRF